MVTMLNPNAIPEGSITQEMINTPVLAAKQNITDESLATIAKTIVGAINEVYNGGLKDASISTSKIKDGAITEPKLDTDLINIITSAVQPADLASALASYVAKADILDTTGSATDKVMSQHVVTEAINGITNKVTELDVLKNAGYLFMGVATPKTNPGEPDQKVFYIAGPGGYNNFNNIQINDGEIGIFAYNNTWAASKIQLSGKQESREYEITQGQALNTTSGANRVMIDIESGKPFKVKVNYAGGLASDEYTLYFYKALTGSYDNKQIFANVETEFTLDADYTGGIGLYVSAAKARETGTVSVQVTIQESISQTIEALRAEIERIEQELTGKADTVVESINLFDKNSNQIIDNSYINGTGGFASNSAYLISAPIPVPAGGSIITNKLGGGTGLALYNENDVYQGIIKTTSPAVLTNLLSTLLYARVSVPKNSVDTVIINRGTSSVPYQPYTGDRYVLRTDDILQETGESEVKTMSQKAISAIATEAAKVTPLDNKINTKEYFSQIYTITQGVAINTTTATIRFYPPYPIKANTTFKVKVSYPEGNDGDKYVIYFYKTTSGPYTSTEIINNVETEFTFDEEYSGGVGFYISADKAVANGTAQVTLTLIGDVDRINTQLQKLDSRVSVIESKRLKLSDALYHWMKGEKFPIGFIGDSTTDGTSTTGWTVTNSHPGQDAQNWLLNTPEGQAFEPDKEWETRVYDAHLQGKGKGTVDYVCDKAYPKILETLLRAELNSNVLRVYNLGYYGASLNTYIPQLDTIFGGVYADVKMVGITLFINDRGNYNSDATFIEGTKTKLEQMVNYFLGKNIVPFLVTSQVVTQWGNNPNTGNVYDYMYNNHIQKLANLVKRDVAEKYQLEIIDMNAFGQLLLSSSDYSYSDLSEDLHFKDLGHKLEAGFLFSEIIPYVNKTNDAKTLYLGLNTINAKTNIKVGHLDNHYVSGPFKCEIPANTTKLNSSDELIYDAYLFNNSINGKYDVKYITPQAIGYIVVDGDTSNPIQISTATQISDHYELSLGSWDIGLHHVQVYSGETNTISFRGFLLTLSE